jgi:hypothetical protein
MKSWVPPVPRLWGQGSGNRAAGSASNRAVANLSRGQSTPIRSLRSISRVPRMPAGSCVGRSCAPPGLGDRWEQFDPRLAPWGYRLLPATRAASARDCKESAPTGAEARTVLVVSCGRREFMP